jgi:hypothetical protein
MFILYKQDFHLIYTPQVYHTTQGTPDCDGEREILPDLREQQARPPLRQQDSPSGHSHHCVVRVPGFLSSRPNWLPSSASDPPPPLVPRGDMLAREDANSNEGRDTLFL